MPSKKKKYNSRFPPARIKKIMQSDDEVGKVAAVVPIIISRALEIFVETLLKDSSKITHSRNARTLTPAHLKASILNNSQFSFLKDIVSSIPDIQQSAEEEQGEASMPLGTGPSASGVKFYRRTSKSNTNSISHTRGRGRPKKVAPSVSTAEEDEENEDDEDGNDTAEDEDDDNEEEGSSCDNSNCNPSSSPKLQAVSMQQMSTFSLPRKPALAEDDDYDA